MNCTSHLCNVVMVAIFLQTKLPNKVAIYKT